jgi:hypothetical protein
VLTLILFCLLAVDCAARFIRGFSGLGCRIVAPGLVETGFGNSSYITVGGRCRRLGLGAIAFALGLSDRGCVSVGNSRVAAPGLFEFGFGDGGCTGVGNRCCGLGLGAIALALRLNYIGGAEVGGELGVLGSYFIDRGVEFAEIDAEITDSGV